MLEIGATIVAAGVAATIFIQWPRIGGVTAVAQAYRAKTSEQMPVAGIARWQHAVEHIDAAPHGLDNIFWPTDSHQVTGPLLRHLRRQMVQHLQPLFFRLPH